jgi:hypothetical protein
MPLDLGALTDAVEAHLGATQPNTAAAAAAFATVYDTYCQGATFDASVPTLTGRKALFETVLAAGLAAGMPGTPTALGNAVAAYWAPTPSPVPVVGVQSGTVVGCPGAASIGAALASMLAIPNTAATAAAALAAALDTATRTVTATVTPPPGTVLPIA